MRTRVRGDGEEHEHENFKNFKSASDSPNVSLRKILDQQDAARNRGRSWYLQAKIEPSVLFKNKVARLCFWRACPFLKHR